MVLALSAKEPPLTFIIFCSIVLLALIVPFKFKVPVLSVIKPKLFVPYTFNMPALDISPLLVKVVFTVAIELFVNTVPVATSIVP